MGSCCVYKNKNLVVERITVVKLPSSDKGQLISPSSWLGKLRRSSLYMVNNEDISKKYIFQEQIGTGYFGTVKLVIPINDKNKKYACKSIDKSKLTIKKINNLIREIEALSMVDHPNIIKYHETYNDNRYFHIIMEYCSGGELFDRILQKKFFSETEVCSLIFKLSSAIHHCHSLGIVHRDLKPENILYENQSDFSDIKIIDFGLSRKIRTDDDLHSIVGSPFYVAPEVLDGSYDSKCDVWSIAVITYCLLCGKPPFYSDNKDELFKKIKTQSVSFKDKIWDNISDEAKDFISSILVKNSSKRPNCKRILKMPWFQKILEEDLALNQLDPEILTQIQNFQRPRQLTKEVIRFVVKEFDTKAIEDLKRAFNILDKDKTGFVTLSLLQNAFNYCKIDINKEEIQKIYKNFNYKIRITKSDTGMLNQEEFEQEALINYSSFIAIAMDKKRLLNRNVLWEAFKTFDTDQSGYISIFNIEKAIERTGKKKSFEEIKFMFNEVGLDLDAQISFEDFCQIIEKDL